MIDVRHCKSTRQRKTLGLNTFSLTHIQYQRNDSTFWFATIVEHITMLDVRARNKTTSWFSCEIDSDRLWRSSSQAIISEEQGRQICDLSKPEGAGMVGS